MKYSIPVNSSLKKSLKTYENSVINTSQKIPKIPLPPSVTSHVSMPLTEGLEITSTDFEEFAEEVGQKLLKIRYEGQKNHLYKITLLVGNFDSREDFLLENARSITKEQALSLSTRIPIPGTASGNVE